MANGEINRIIQAASTAHTKGCDAHAPLVAALGGIFSYFEKRLRKIELLLVLSILAGGGNLALELVKEFLG